MNLGLKSFLEKIAMHPLMFKSRTRRSINLLIVALIFVSAMLGTAKAGDIAKRHVLGFSPDGTYFAFEEFGIQDGSGFPYSNIYITNTRSNSWVKGSPFRVLLKDETDADAFVLQQRLITAREQALSQADAMLKKYNISMDGELLAHNPISEVDRNPKKVTVFPGIDPYWQKQRLTFRLKDMAIETKRCKDYRPEAQTGYTLSVEHAAGKTKILHKDARIPTSRGCPKRYAISDIIKFVPKVDPSAKGDKKKVVYIVLLQVFSYGFEGDDGRYLANSSWLPSLAAIN